jgi:dTMP kinase
MEKRGLEHTVTQEPGGTPLGEAIRSVFLDRQWEEVDGTVETLLIFASRRQHLVEVIDPALAAGRHVLCDRFTDSTFAYQGFGRGVELDLLRKVDELATGSRVPDATLLFDLASEQARLRGQSQSRQEEPGGVDRLDAENLAFYQRVREGYLSLSESAGDRYRVIPSAGSIEETTARLESALVSVFGSES